MKFSARFALLITLIGCGCTAPQIKIPSSKAGVSTPSPAITEAGTYKDYDLNKLRIMNFGLGSSFKEIDQAMRTYDSVRQKKGLTPLMIDRKAQSKFFSKFDESVIVALGAEGQLGYVTVQALYDSKGAYHITQSFSSMVLTPNMVISDYVKKYGQPSYTYRPLKNSNMTVYLNWDFNENGKQYVGSPGGSPCNGAFSPFANRNNSIQPFYQLYGVADRTLSDRVRYGDKDLGITSIPACSTSMVLRISMDPLGQGDLNKTVVTGYQLSLADVNHRLDRQKQLLDLMKSSK